MCFFQAELKKVHHGFDQVQSLPATLMKKNFITPVFLAASKHQHTRAFYFNGASIRKGEYIISEGSSFNAFLNKARLLQPHLFLFCFPEFMNIKDQVIDLVDKYTVHIF